MTKKMKRIVPSICCGLLGVFSLAAGPALALERGAILYHSSKDDTIYGREAALELPCSVLQIAFREMKSGHVGLYIGNNRVIHAVMPAVEETDSRNFITQDDLDEGCKYIGAKVPANYADATAWPEERKDQLILLAKEQVGAHYDVQFRHQKGPYDDGFTCVGLVEYLYEQLGYDITPSGYYKSGAGGRTETQVYHCETTAWSDWEGENAFSQTVEFSRFEHPLADTLDVGKVHDDDRYMFFPYTQYLQTTTVSVETDVPISGGSGEDEDNDDDDSDGCFIATAAYGSALHPHVAIFRALRDRFLLANAPGRLFVAAYYRFSPPLAGFISRHDTLKAASRIVLLPLLALSYLLLHVGPAATFALLVVLVVLPIAFTRRRRVALSK